MNRFLTTKKAIEALLAQQKTVVAAIDGPCTSGKTTLAQQLADHFDCNIIHMDDFFLRPEQRTPERFAETGGNVDYERFQQEVLVPLASGKDFFYRPFSCSTFSLCPPVPVPAKQLNIIEGTYSHHPYFGNPYDLKICLTVSPKVQRQRILERPEFLHRRFFEEWIPMENRYLKDFQIPEICDILL